MLLIMIMALILMTFLTRIGIKRGIERTIINLFIWWWSLWLIVSTFNPFDLYAVSPYAYALLLIHIITFYVGYISYRGTHNSRSYKVLPQDELIRRIL